MTVQTLTIVTDDGVRLAVEVYGPESAPVLLLSNSLGTTMAMWDPQLADLSARYRVVRHDGRGQGQSTCPPGAASMDRLGRDALTVLDALGAARAHFCGLSMGGMVGQWLATHAPERLLRLVLANTSACMAPAAAWQARLEGVLSHGMGPLAQASLERWFTPAFLAAEPEQAEWIRQMLLANDPQGYAACCAAIRDMDQRRTAALNTVPTLVIAGQADPATSVADAQFLVDAAGDARLVTLPAAHLSNVECPQQFTQAVIDHLG
ncbi:3-oxoadipate enol-lactonase [Novosphingobium jiangmenense]|uniref:3-oxoadipate enol-lactonase n=1 Tax=Novosphingobium jiangmenense TaxID=2791981 RepID=A0ABS0HBE6_9SPHN|nr:3-oxoadipate enol-lactonase [Novosphingobium jiangmenense]MBF9149594.1 3-oxoadipate enol-lactonase [Novosphingobium jiangmenense]